MNLARNFRLLQTIKRMAESLKLKVEGNTLPNLKKKNVKYDETQTQQCIKDMEKHKSDMDKNIFKSIVANIKDDKFEDSKGLDAVESNINQPFPWQPKSRPFTVSVEGNIGSGKSTLLKHFSTFPQVSTFPEPLDKWTNLGGHNLLHKLYEDPKRWNFLFQSYAQLTRLHIHLQNSDSSIKLIERSFHNNRFCFVENAVDAGYLQKAEFEVISEYFDFFEKHFDVGVDLIIYLKTDPEVVFERMKNRGRSEEATVPLEYLKRVHYYYERWLIEGKPRGPPSPVITINGNLTLNSIYDEYEKVKEIILNTQSLGENALPSCS